MMQGIGAFGRFGLLRNANKVGKNGAVRRVGLQNERQRQ